MMFAVNGPTAATGGRPYEALQADRTFLRNEAKAAVVRLAKRDNKVPEMPEVWEDMESRGKVPPDYATQPVRGQYPPTAFLSEDEIFSTIQDVINRCRFN